MKIASFGFISSTSFSSHERGDFNYRMVLCLTVVTSPHFYSLKSLSCFNT